MNRTSARRSRRWLALLLLTVLLWPATAGAQPPDSGERTGRSHPHWMKGGQAAGVHYENYIRLLVEKYAPQTKQQWEPVLAEGARLRQEWVELKRQGERGKAHKPHPEKDQTSIHEHKQVFRQFHDAVTSQDPGKIREALQALLPVHKELNARLAQRLHEQSQA